MKFVFFFDLIPPWQERLAVLQHEFPELEIVLRESKTESDIVDADAFVGGYIPPEDLKRAGNLKIVFFNFTGPNFLPFDELAARGIIISNTHGNAGSVAERAVALALSYYGKIIPYHHDLKQGRWHGVWSGKDVADTWESLYGKPCALIGTGEIGRWIARYLKAFGCQVVGFKQKPVSSLPENFDHITQDLFEALEGSELVFISLPQTRETEGLIDAGTISKMAGKFLVNVGRGGVVDEAALFGGLKDGVLKGAGLDVWYDYPDPARKGQTVFPSRFPFYELDNVVLSPHIGGLTPQAVDLNITQTIENIRAYFKKGRPIFEIDPTLMY